MSCHVCGAEAVDRCYTCGELFCPDHGKVNCIHCEFGIRPGDRRADRISAVFLAKTARPGWWRPQEAEEYDPPACRTCGALARRRCYNCQELCCPEHAGKKGLCLACQKSARTGALILLGLGLFVLVLSVAALLQPLQH